MNYYYVGAGNLFHQTAGPEMFSVPTYQNPVQVVSQLDGRQGRARSCMLN